MKETIKGKAKNSEGKEVAFEVRFPNDKLTKERFQGYLDAVLRIFEDAPSDAHLLVGIAVLRTLRKALDKNLDECYEMWAALHDSGCVHKIMGWPKKG